MSTEDRIVEAEGLRFEVGYRVFGGDRGPAIRVWGDVEGRPVQLLRFDCFEKGPHYHYDPDGKDDHRNLDKAEIPDPLEWSLKKIETELPEMVAQAGQQALAAKVDRKAIAAILPRIRSALREVMPASG